MPLKAVDGVSFDVCPGETLGIVGESGCGQVDPRPRRPAADPADRGHGASGSGTNIAGSRAGQMRPSGASMQIIFQDPLASLNPRMTVGEIIAEPLDTLEPDLSAGRAQAARAGDAWTRSACCRR